MPLFFCNFIWTLKIANFPRWNRAPPGRFFWAIFPFSMSGVITGFRGRWIVWRIWNRAWAPTPFRPWFIFGSDPFTAPLDHRRRRKLIVRWNSDLKKVSGALVVFYISLTTWFFFDFFAFFSFLGLSLGGVFASSCFLSSFILWISSYSHVTNALNLFFGINSKSSS